MRDVEYTIWNEDIGRIEDWEDENGEQMSYEDATELNYEYLEDERYNLDVPTDGEIICLADLGLWYGRRPAHKLMGHNVKNILYGQVDGMSECHWYSDGKDICCREAHHDGTNHYIYRIMKGKTHDEQVDNAEKLCSKPITPHRLGYYTKSLEPVVAKVYGR